MVYSWDTCWGYCGISLHHSYWAEGISVLSSGVNYTEVIVGYYVPKPEDHLSPALKPGSKDYKPRGLIKLNKLPKGVVVKQNKKITQNILLTAVMATMPLLVVRGDTYQIGLIIECIAAVISLLLLFTSANRRKNFPLSHLAAILWLFVPVSFLFLLQTSLFGGGFEGLSNWARTGLIVGIVAVVLTSIQLFRVNR